MEKAIAELDRLTRDAAEALLWEQAARDRAFQHEINRIDVDLPADDLAPGTVEYETFADEVPLPRLMERLQTDVRVSLVQRVSQPAALRRAGACGPVEPGEVYILVEATRRGGDERQA